MICDEACAGSLVGFRGGGRCYVLLFMLPPSRTMRPSRVPPTAGHDAMLMLLPSSGAVAAAATYSLSYADPYFAALSATFVRLAA